MIRYLPGPGLHTDGLWAKQKDIGKTTSGPFIVLYLGI
jgi:hypothetical protein